MKSHTVGKFWEMYDSLSPDVQRKADKEGPTMSAVLQLEQAVSQLPPKELARFRKWFEEFDAKIWDKQFEQDVKSGKLDKLANRAITDFRAGKFKQPPVLRHAA